MSHGDVAKTNKLWEICYKDTTKSFYSGISVLSKSREAINGMLERLDESIGWVRMKFKAQKSQSVAFVKKVQKEAKFRRGGVKIYQRWNNNQQRVDGTKIY